MSELADHFAIAPGTRIADRFVILEKLGQGGTAQVFRARDLESGDVVALKHLMLGSNLRDVEKQNRIARFENEARTMQFLDHPFIMAVHDYFVDDGNHFIVAEYLEGFSLPDYLAERKPSVREILIYLAQIAQALDYSHSRDVVHRDVKPDNVMVLPGKGAKLLDFGIAKFEYNSLVTTDGTILGTVAYMSPEQLESSRNTTHQSDIYSLGVLMYQVFAGRLPFNAETPGAAVVEIFSKSPPTPMSINPEVGPDLNQLILTCMHKRPELRFSSCQQVQRMLQELIKQVYTPGAVVNAKSKPCLPRIRAFEQFDFLRVVTTLCMKQATGLCMVWSSFQETNIYIEAGKIRQVAMKHREIDPEQGFYDVICWHSGNFCFLPTAHAGVDQFQDTPTSLLLDAAEVYLQDFEAMWEMYRDQDIPEIAMYPAAQDKVSAVAETLIKHINNQSCIGQIYAMVNLDRLSVLQGLKELEDRQFIFVDRIREEAAYRYP